jgi:hypothetical protein
VNPGRAFIGSQGFRRQINLDSHWIEFHEFPDWLIRQADTAKQYSLESFLCAVIESIALDSARVRDCCNVIHRHGLSPLNS